MRILKFYFISSLILADGIDNITFDWGGQFGYVSQNGIMQWNKDWNSNQLLFDGTWSIFPRMFGPRIDEGFRKPIKELLLAEDSVGVNSYFKYDQGDYLLDRFSFGLDYNTDNRHAYLHGFKRSYAGSFNQYNNDSFQPLQQSYIVSYRSVNDKDEGGFSLGHFNTYSGFPDTLDAGLFDNRITTSNIFWESSIGNLETRIAIDHFLQRYLTRHSLSYFDGSRHLSRSQYQGNIIWRMDEVKQILIQIESNNRSIRSNTLYRFDWAELSLDYSSNIFKITSSYITDRNISFFNYGLIIDRRFRNIRIYFDYRSNHHPMHPYYTMINAIDEVPSFINETSIVSMFDIEFEKNQFSATISQSKDDNILWESILEEPIDNNIHRMIDLKYKTSLIPHLGIETSYKLQESKIYYSDGIGKWMGLKLESSFGLFKDYMLIDANITFQRLEDRFNSSLINPIEMVPLHGNAVKNDMLTPVNIINASITAYVSTFTISYEWFNIGEIILASSGKEDNNYFTIHPLLPALGRQINLSIKWEFQD